MSRRSYRHSDMMDDVPCTFPVVTEERNGGVIQYIDAFNREWPLQSDIAIHLNAFRMGLSKEQGGLGKLRHLVEAHNLIWPHLADSNHAWMIRRFSRFCQAEEKGWKIISLAGGAGTAKSADVARYALLWWWANPSERAVVMCSTDIESLKRRIWSYVVEGAMKSKGGLPRDVTSAPNPRLMWDKREDTKHGIHGAALKQGAVDNTLSSLIGIHPTDALLFIVDEATDVNPAIKEVRVNLDDGNDKYLMIVIGNSKSRLDPHGIMSEPLKGWNSIDPDVDEEWPTRDGICMYFDCYRSPALHAKNKDKLQFLINERKIKSEESRLGKNDPKFWRFVRGFWSPEDENKVVLTLSLIDRHRAREKARWGGRWQIGLGALDPAFSGEGDECILGFGKMGVMDNGVVGLEYGEVLSLQLDSRSKEPINYQIVRQTKEHCIARGVRPEHFGMDSWAFGSGASDILRVHWSDEVHQVVAIGPPSDRWVDSAMAERAVELYENAVSEYWFAMKTFVEAGQIRGLGDEVIEELVSRGWEWKQRKKKLEPKIDYKKRMGKEEGPTGSPDRADMAVILLEVARRAGFEPGAREIDEREHDEDWQDRWERETGKLRGGVERSRERGQTHDEREMTWQSDGILNSTMFRGKGNGNF